MHPRSATKDAAALAASPTNATLLRPADVADRLKVSRATAYRLIKSGAIRKAHVGESRATRVVEADLVAYIQSIRDPEA